MQFTPRDVVQGARDRAPRPQEVTLTSDQIVRTFNDLMLDLVQIYVTHDPERLAERQTIPNADVSSGDTIDVTQSATIEWLKIHAIDWRGASGDDYADGVIIVPQEARHRADSELGHMGWPIGYFTNRDRDIFKLARWNGVHDIQIHGVLAPTTISPGDWLTIFDYPAPLYRALQHRFALQLSDSLEIEGDALQLLMNDVQLSMGSLNDDAEEHVQPGLRVEDIPHASFYR